MARLRQQHPQNYVNSGNIHTEFENLIRYTNAAELGNKTVGELLSILFNEEGVFRGPIQMRVDAQSGLQFRVGMYQSEAVGWQDLVDIGSLRGPSGSNAGTIEGPFFYNRQDVVITTGVESIAVTSGGTLYASAPTVTFSAPNDSDGVRPTAVTTINANGEVDSVTITSQGSGYLSAPTVTISAPANAQGTIATGTPTMAAVGAAANVLPYTFDADTDDVVVYKNGLLLSELTSVGTSEYVSNPAADTITVDASVAVALGDKITIYSVRSQSVTNYRRNDVEITASTSTVPFVHSAEEKILVWRNGILQEDGGSADYLTSPAANTITFLDQAGLSSGDKITIITVENQALKTIGGLMFEDEYTDAQGFIRYAKLSIQEDEIPQSKVANLAGSLGNKANIVAQSNSPTSPLTKDLWLDISRVPAILKFYDGTQWLETSPESSLPTFIQSNAGQYVRVNGTGTALEYGDIDFSSLVPKTYMGAANGVATLDTAGKLPINQLPETFSTTTIPFLSVWEDSQAVIGNKTYFVSRIYKQTIRIDGISFKLNAGTCTIQLSVDGVAVGPTYSVTTTAQQYDLNTVIEIVATQTSRRIEIVTTNASGAQTLEVGLAAATVNV
jgi:hypothetical protein